MRSQVTPGWYSCSRASTSPRQTGWLGEKTHNAAGFLSAESDAVALPLLLSSSAAGLLYLSVPRVIIERQYRLSLWPGKIRSAVTHTVIGACSRRSAADTDRSPPFGPHRYARFSLQVVGLIAFLLEGARAPFRLPPFVPTTVPVTGCLSIQAEDGSALSL